MSLISAQSPRTASGFTLMEVLIAMVVMGVGIITIVELQTDALTGSQQSGARMHAAVLASGMADRIRANPAGQGNYDGMTVSSAPTANCYNTNTTCNAAQLATHDVWRWQQKLGNTLPGGAGIVCRDGADGTTDDGTGDGTGSGSPSCNSGANSPLAVKVWWTRKSTEQGQTANTRRFVLTFRP